MLQQQQQQLQLPGLQHSVENAPPVGVRDLPFWQVSEVLYGVLPRFCESVDVVETRSRMSERVYWRIWVWEVDLMVLHCPLFRMYREANRGTWMYRRIWPAWWQRVEVLFWPPDRCRVLASCILLSTDCNFFFPGFVDAHRSVMGAFAYMESLVVQWLLRSPHHRKAS